jgi:hypothetical protein
LLLRRLEDRPDHPDKSHIWGHAADIYEALNRAELARAARQHAVALVRRKGRPHPVDCAVYLALLAQGLREGREIEPLLAEAFRLFPRRVREERWDEAVLRFEALLEAGRRPVDGGWVAYDRRLFDALPKAALEACRVPQPTIG